MAASSQELDLAYLQDLYAAGGAALLRDVVGTFLTTVPPRLATLRQAIEGADVKAAEQVAHSLVSSSASLGLTQLQRAARAVEQAAPGGTASVPLLQALERAYAAAPGLLEAAVAETTAARSREAGS